MDLELTGKIAIVTGASAGIGRGAAKALAAEGVQTVLVARRAELLATLQDEIERDGCGRPAAIAIDLYDRASPAGIRDRVLAEFGRVDIVVHSAGGSRPVPIDAGDDLWDEAFAINFTAIRKLTQAVMPTMIAQKWGRIINITGSSEPTGSNAANAAKAGVHAWAKGLSRVVGEHGITINSLSPGRIHSEQIDNKVNPGAANQAEFAKGIPAGYFGEPHDMAYLIAFLCSPKARYVTGERIHVDGGLHRAF